MMNGGSDFSNRCFDIVNGWVDGLYHGLGIQRNIYIRQGDWDVLANELCFLFVVVIILLMFLTTIWRFIKERHYPFWYRMFGYLGCFFLFIGPFLSVEIEEVLKESFKIYGAMPGLLLLPIGMGIFCFGISAKLFPENGDPRYDRRKDGKMLVGIGIYFIGFSILELYDCIFG